MRRFILFRYILREHFGPFCFSFATITLIFLLDLVFRHLSRILSKGLPPAVIVEFLGLNLAWIVATAAPMAVLTATLMAFGRLAADHEITAMQASGISLVRQTTPIFLAAFALAAGLVWFNNNVLPDWNYRARVLAMDIAHKKPGVKIEPGIWCNEIPNYGLLVESLEDSAEVTKALALLIDDHTQPDLRRTISARSGLIQPSLRDGALLLTLFNGIIQEINLKKLEEFRHLAFAKHLMSIKIDDDMFWRRSESDVRTDREKNAATMWQEIQENRAAMIALEQQINQAVGADFFHRLGRTFDLLPDNLDHPISSPPDKTSLLRQQQRLLRQIDDLLAAMQHRELFSQSLLVEIHKKYAIPVACLVFVLIGAPLGVSAQRGGLATGVGLSLGFFLLYWAFLIGGEDLADREIVSPFVAIWSANFLVGGLGLLVFQQIAAGKLVRFSIKPPGWWRASSFRHAVKSFRRKPELPESQHAPRDTERPISVPELLTEKTAPLPVLNQATSQVAPPADPLAFSLPELEFTAAPEILHHFAHRTRADWVILADRDGKPLAFCDNPTSPARTRTDLEILAKLAASQMSGIQVLGQNIGEIKTFTCIFQEGVQRNIFIYAISENFILTALIEKTVALGLVRIQANAAAASLRKVLEMT